MFMYTVMVIVYNQFQKVVCMIQTIYHIKGKDEQTGRGICQMKMPYVQAQFIVTCIILRSKLIGLLLKKQINRVMVHPCIYFKTIQNHIQVLKFQQSPSQTSGTNFHLTITTILPGQVILVSELMPKNSNPWKQSSWKLMCCQVQVIFSQVSQNPIFFSSAIAWIVPGYDY